MKPAHVDLRDATDLKSLIVSVLRSRLREVRLLAEPFDLARSDPRNQQSLHAFRIACKRLRYALERFETAEPSLHETAEQLALLQDALGEARDRDVLLAILPAAMTQTERRLRREREEFVERAAALWREAQEALHACALIVFE